MPTPNALRLVQLIDPHNLAAHRTFAAAATGHDFRHVLFIAHDGKRRRAAADRVVPSASARPLASSVRGRQGHRIAAQHLITVQERRVCGPQSPPLWQSPPHYCGPNSSRIKIRHRSQHHVADIDPATRRRGDRVNPRNRPTRR
jgi:hypothetical protein